MRKTCCLLIGMLILFSGIVHAGDIVVDPPDYNVDLIGGDTIIRPITITWTGEAAVVGFIETGIIPDGEGIDIVYSEDPIILYPGVPNTIDMTIATAINLVPGDYVITTLVFTEIEKVIEYRSSGGGGGTTYIYETIEIENITQINILLDIIQQLNDKLNATNENNSEQIALLTSIIDTLNNAVVFLEDQLQQEPEEKEDKCLLFFVFLIIVAIMAVIFIIVMACLYHKFRVLESQKIKEIKENENKNNK